MIAGHFGLAAAAKRVSPAAPLWALMLGAAWLDVVFVPLFAAGIETIASAPGTTGGYGAGIIHADYTHSLIGALLLSALYGAFFLRRGRSVVLALAAIAFSHWLLDLIVHRHDMPILPGNLGNLPLLGFGLWRFAAMSILAEAALVLAGAWLYRQAAQSIAAGKATERQRGDLVAALIAIFGLIVLALDASGLVG